MFIVFVFGTISNKCKRGKELEGACRVGGEKAPKMGNPKRVRVLSSAQYRKHRTRLFEGNNALKSTLSSVSRPEPREPRARELAPRERDQRFKGSKTLKGKTPRTLESEIGLRGPGRRKPLRG
jgi:hypothetical protein